MINRLVLENKPNLNIETYAGVFSLFIVRRYRNVSMTNTA